MRIRTIALLSAAAILSAAAPASAAGRVQLRLRPAEGQSVRRSLSWDQKLVIGREGIAGELRRRTEADISLVVARVEPSGWAVARFTWEAVRFRQEDLFGSIAWDSARPTAPVPGPVRDLAPLVGQSYVARISPAGRVTEIQSVEPGVVAGIMAAYPETPVAAGDRWTARTSLQRNVPLTVDTVFTLRERRGGTAFIEATSTLSAAEGPTSFDSPVALGLGGNGTQTGVVEVDEATGWPVRARLRQSYRGQIKLDTGTDLLGELAAPFTGTGELVIEPR